MIISPYTANCAANIFMICSVVCLFFAIRYSRQRDAFRASFFHHRTEQSGNLMEALAAYDTLVNRIFSGMAFLIVLAIVCHCYAVIYSGSFSKHLVYAFLLSAFLMTILFVIVYSLSEDWHLSHIGYSAFLIGIMNLFIILSLFTLLMLLPLIAKWSLAILGGLAVWYVFFSGSDD